MIPPPKPARHGLACVAILLLGPLACVTPGSRLEVPVVEVGPPREGKLPHGWSERPGDERCGVWVLMKRQVDLEALGLPSMTKKERREAVLAALLSLADDRGGGIESFLRREPRVDRLEGLAVVNGLVLRATRDVVTEIAGREDVAYVVEEKRSERGAWGSASSWADEREEEAWWLDAIGAREAWQRGLEGDGVVIGFIDSGASAGHELTREGFRGGTDSWYDPEGGGERPVETHPGSHGTSIIGLTVGRGGEGRSPGVAPGARWVAALGFREGRFDNLDLVLSIDWMLRRAKPDILVAAWEIPDCTRDPAFDRILSVLRASEIFVPFAAGNDGPGAGSNRYPANAIGIYPGDAVVFSVGGTIRGGGRLPETSEGPNALDPTEIFPRVCAPAAELLGAHALAPNLYRLQRGTSFSVGLAAGAAALILQRQPDLEVDDLERCLMETAMDLGDPGPDNVFGHGLIRIRQALDWVEERKE